MASIPVNMKGAWDASESYVIFDGVTHNNSTWVAVKASINQEPTAGSDYWYDAGSVWNDAGKVAITPKGNYNSATNYEPLDLVKNLDKVWLSKKYNTNVAPAEGDYWMLIIDAIADFTGATSSANGSHGLVPQPQAGDEGKVLYGDGDWKLITGGAFYGTSTTAGNVAAKVVTTEDSNFALKTGADIIIKFANDDTAGAITLAIDGETAKPVYKDGVAITANVIKATGVYEFVYNGTQFELVGGSSGHTILNKNGQSMTARKNLQFGRSEVTDDSVNDVTKINVNNAIEISWADYQLLSANEKNDGTVWYIYDYPSLGGSYAFISISAMNNAITNGDVPYGAFCVVSGTVGIWVNNNGIAERKDSSNADEITYDNTTTGFGDDLQESTDNLVRALGTVETGNTATAAHAVGSYFLWKGQMVKTTVAIAVNGAITLGTNVMATNSIGDILGQISNGSFSNISQYWTYGVSNSSIMKCNNIVILNFNSSSVDTAVPSGGYTTIGEVPYKPLRNIFYTKQNASGYNFALSITTNGLLQVYNYESGAHNLEFSTVIVYFTND